VGGEAPELSEASAAAIPPPRQPHRRKTEMTKPRILVRFEGETVVWHSDGWGHDSHLMAKAKRLISQGETPNEVIELLRKVFEVELSN
jgi:hypothetical protein